MGILGVIIVCVIVFVLYQKGMNKIDAEEKTALSTPGVADRIRDNYQDVVDYLLSKPNTQILFERKDMIKIGKGDDEYYAINYSSSGLLIAYVKWSRVQKEWKFQSNEDPKHIVYELDRF